MVVFGRQRGLGTNRLVDFRVEWVIEWVDDLEAMSRERLQHFALDHVHALHDSRGVDAGWIDVGEPGEVIERVDETTHHLALSAPSSLLAFPGRPFPEVVVFGSQPKMLVPLLVDPSLPLLAG
jgi:hypothetical protein